jgi:hypothetical protein
MIMDQSRNHSRFEDVWTWDQTPQKIPIEEGFLESNADISYRSDPWMLIYHDADGGLSACTFVKESSTNFSRVEVFAFYNEQLWDYMNDNDVQEPDWDDLSFKEIWTNLSTVVSPTYESMKDILNKIGYTNYYYPMYLLQSIRVFQSINTYTIV